MIRIAIADPNETFYMSLKTLLEQVEGFKVRTLVPNEYGLRKSDDEPVDILLIDYDLYQQRGERIIANLPNENGTTKIILLAMYEDEIESLFEKGMYILKSAGKQKFENRIRQMAGA